MDGAIEEGLFHILANVSDQVLIQKLYCAIRGFRDYVIDHKFPIKIFKDGLSKGGRYMCGSLVPKDKYHIISYINWHYSSTTNLYIYIRGCNPSGYYPSGYYETTFSRRHYIDLSVDEKSKLLDLKQNCYKLGKQLHPMKKKEYRRNIRQQVISFVKDYIDRLFTTSPSDYYYLKYII